MGCDASEPLAGCTQSEAESNQSLRMMLLRARPQNLGGSTVTGYQGRSIGIWKSSGHPAIPAPQDCPWLVPGATERYRVHLCCANW